VRSDGLRRFAGRGIRTAAGVGGTTPIGVTLVAGPACATATVPCELIKDGTVRRCR